MSYLAALFFCTEKHGWTRLVLLFSHDRDDDNDDGDDDDNDDDDDEANDDSVVCLLLTSCTVILAIPVPPFLKIVYI